MKNTILYLAIAMLLASECYLYLENSKKTKEIRLKNNDIERMATYNNTMEVTFAASIQNMGMRINGELFAKDTAGMDISLYEIANQIDGNMLVFRYSDRMCNECVEHALRIFADHKDYMDKSRIVFLANNASPRALKINKKEYGLQGCNLFLCPNLGIPADETASPYIMMINKDLRILNIYFPNKSTRGTDYDYKHVKYMYDKLIKEN